MSERDEFNYTERDIEQARAAGKAWERDRIIKLLEGWAERLEAVRPEAYEYLATYINVRINTMNKMIAEIKGEQK